MALKLIVMDLLQLGQLVFTVCAINEVWQLGHSSLTPLLKILASIFLGLAIWFNAFSKLSSPVILMSIKSPLYFRMT